MRHSTMSYSPTRGSDESDAEVIASVDDADRSPTFIIADVSRDEAWVSVRESDAPILTEWC